MKLPFAKAPGRGPLSAELELPLMDILWTLGRPLKGRELYEEILKSKSIAYTTALTVLDRLARKGLVSKDKATGTIQFSARVSREEYQASVVGSLMRDAFEVSPDLAISAFADAASGLSREDLERLAKLLEEKKREESR